MQRRDYPDKCKMRFNGVPYEVDLRAFRRALVYRQIGGQLLGGQSELAAASRLSRSTVSRTFAGRSVSLRALTAIAATLGLNVNDVTIPLDTNSESRSPEGEARWA